MQGIEFRDVFGEPDTKTRDATLVALKNGGILTIACGHPAINPTIRFLPPYIIEKEHIDMLADCLRSAFL